VIAEVQAHSTMASGVRVSGVLSKRPDGTRSWQCVQSSLQSGPDYVEHCHQDGGVNRRAAMAQPCHLARLLSSELLRFAPGCVTANNVPLAARTVSIQNNNRSNKSP